VRKIDVQSMPLAVEARSPHLQFVSNIRMEKHTFPNYTLQMAAQIAFVCLVPTDETTQQDFQKAFVLYSRKQNIPSKMLVTT
jgi:hypothetical protein